MYGLARRGLIVMLAMALVVAGLPPSHAKSSHAKPCASVDAAQAKHSHHDMAAVAPSTSAHHHETTKADAPHSQDDRQSDAAACQCLNCGQCVASFVALVHREIQLQRRTSPISYGFFVQGDARAFVFIDPGIPIASM